MRGYLSEAFAEQVLTWLEHIADHAERLLGVEQAIRTSGVCKTPLFPDMG